MVDVTDIIASLESYADIDRVELGRRYHPTNMKILGVTNPNQKVILKELKALTKNTSFKDKIKLATKLVNTNIFECQHIAYEYLGKDNNVLANIQEQDVDTLNQNLDNWVSVDTFGIYITGKAWRNNIIPTEKIINYFYSNNFWTRRLALVSTVSLNLKSQGGVGDPDKTLEICKIAVNDHHDMINKALSWALRELSKSNKEVVFDFMEKYEKSLHSRVKKEVYNKLITGKKY